MMHVVSIGRRPGRPITASRSSLVSLRIFPFDITPASLYEYYYSTSMWVDDTYTSHYVSCWECTTLLCQYSQSKCNTCICNHPHADVLTSSYIRYAYICVPLSLPKAMSLTTPSHATTCFLPIRADFTVPLFLSFLQTSQIIVEGIRFRRTIVYLTVQRLDCLRMGVESVWVWVWVWVWGQGRILMWRENGRQESRKQK